MAAGDLTASTPTMCIGAAAVKTHIDTLSLGATSDFIKVIPLPNRDNTFLVFSVQRAAA